jgi:hypothetical protein
MTQLIDINRSVQSNEDGHIIERVQQIPQEFLDGLKAKRDVSKERREREFMHCASIPVVVVEKWLAEGYNVYTEPVSKSMARLKNENLDYFLATAKQV